MSAITKFINKIICGDTIEIMKKMPDNSVDFDARTGHNHGTKFIMRQDCLPMLYEKTTVII